jgi:hypothetical protein
MFDTPDCAGSALHRQDCQHLDDIISNPEMLRSPHCSCLIREKSVFVLFTGCWSSMEALMILQCIMYFTEETAASP